MFRVGDRVRLSTDFYPISVCDYWGEGIVKVQTEFDCIVLFLKNESYSPESISIRASQLVLVEPNHQWINKPKEAHA